MKNVVPAPAWAVSRMKCERCGQSGPEIHSYYLPSLPVECHVCGERGMWPEGAKKRRAHRN